MVVAVIVSLILSSNRTLFSWCVDMAVASDVVGSGFESKFLDCYYTWILWEVHAYTHVYDLVPMGTSSLNHSHSLEWMNVSVSIAEAFLNSSHPNSSGSFKIVNLFSSIIWHASYAQCIHVRMYKWTAKDHAAILAWCDFGRNFGHVLACFVSVVYFYRISLFGESALIYALSGYLCVLNR